MQHSGAAKQQTRRGDARTPLEPIPATEHNRRMTAEYIDPRSGQTFPLDQPRWCGPDQTPLLITPLHGLSPDQIDTTTRSLWRYRAAFPFQTDAPITLGEGTTPLIRHTVAGHQALLKCEWFNPTSSFKDRGASVMLSLLRAQGVAAVLEDSSGNGGAAIACYAAAGGMRATIMARPRTQLLEALGEAIYGFAVSHAPEVDVGLVDRSGRSGAGHPRERHDRVAAVDELTKPMIGFTHEDRGPWDKIWDGGKGNNERIPYALAVPDTDNGFYCLPGSRRNGIGIGGFVRVSRTGCQTTKG